MILRLISSLPARSLLSQLFLLLGLVPLWTLAQPSDTVTWANGVVSQATPSNDRARTDLIRQIAGRLRSDPTASAEMSSVGDILDYQLSLLSLDQTSLSDYIDAIKDPRSTPRSRAEYLRNARVDILDRACLLIASLDPRKLTAADAQKISQFVKYASQAIDEFNDPALVGGKTHDFTRLASRINAITKLAETTTDPSARRILGGLRGTLGSIDRRIKEMNVSMPSPMRAFEIPAEVAGAIVDNSRKGMDESAAALDAISRAIAGDATALETFANHAKNVESILSPRSYGHQMMDAMAKRTADRIPFLRTLAYWFTPSEGLEWLVGKWKATSGEPADVMVVEFKRESRGVAGYIVTLNKYATAYGYKTGQLVYRHWAEAAPNDPLRNTYKHVAFGECLYTNPDSRQQFWSRTKFLVGVSFLFGSNQIGVTENNCAITSSVFYEIKRVQ